MKINHIKLAHDHSFKKLTKLFLEFSLTKFCKNIYNIESLNSFLNMNKTVKCSFLPQIPILNLITNRSLFWIVYKDIF